MARFWSCGHGWTAALFPSQPGGGVRDICSRSSRLLHLWLPKPLATGPRANPNNKDSRWLASWRQRAQGRVSGVDGFKSVGQPVQLGRIAYVREFVEPDYHHCEVFFVAASHSGTPMVGTNPGIFDVDHVIKDVRFVPRGEMAEMTIYPEEIKTTFWDDLANEFSGTRYLGVQKSESKTYLDSQAETT